MKYNRRTRGFTLIELITVVVIIALLSGIILKSLSGSRGKSRDGARISDLGQLQLALSLFNDRCGQFPKGASLSTSLNSGCPAGVTLGSFIAQIPSPPSGAGTNPWDTSYYYAWYSVGGKAVNYVLYATLESSNVATSKGLDYSNIPDHTSSLGIWSKDMTSGGGVPFNTCSNAASSIYYCVGPN